MKEEVCSQVFPFPSQRIASSQVVVCTGCGTLRLRRVSSTMTDSVAVTEVSEYPASARGCWSLLSPVSRSEVEPGSEASIDSPKIIQG